MTIDTLIMNVLKLIPLDRSSCSSTRYRSFRDSQKAINSEWFGRMSAITFTGLVVINLHQQHGSRKYKELTGRDF